MLVWLKYKRKSGLTHICTWKREKYFNISQITGYSLALHKPLQMVSWNHSPLLTSKSIHHSGSFAYNDFVTSVGQKENTDSLSYVALPSADTLPHSTSSNHSSVSPPISLEKSLVGWSSWWQKQVFQKYTFASSNFITVNENEELFSLIQQDCFVHFWEKIRQINTKVWTTSLPDRHSFK